MHKIVQDLVTNWDCKQYHQHHSICRHNHGTACSALLQLLEICIRIRPYVDAIFSLAGRAKLSQSGNRLAAIWECGLAKEPASTSIVPRVGER